MLLAQVIGTVVATRKHDKLVGSKIQVIQPINPKNEKPVGNPIICVDTVGAGVGEVVLVVTGSPARLGLDAIYSPVDATIIGIVDQLEIDSQLP